MIVNRDWRPGEPISETEVGQRLGVSRTPAREALKQLYAEGLVEMVPARGYVVVELTDSDIADIHQVRTALEGLAAFEAATRITRAQLGALEDLYAEMEQASAAMDDGRLARLDSQFHSTIAAASGNRYLETMLGQIHGDFERFHPAALASPDHRNSAAREHGKLITALSERKPADARRVAETHVQNALQARQAEP